MFRKFTKKQEILCPLITSDPHTTSPGLPVEGITRNERNAQETEEQKTNIYDKARMLYSRANRSRRVRSGGIL